MNLEDQIWKMAGQSAPQSVAVAPVAPPNVEYGRCTEHQIRNCLACGVKERNAAAEALQTARKAVPAPVAASIAQAAPQPQPVAVTPQPPVIDPASPAAQVVAAAAEYSKALVDLERAERRLSGLEMTTESVKQEIVNLATVRDAAKNKLKELTR